MTPFLLILSVLTPWVIAAAPPDTLTLDEARDAARKHNPIGEQNQLHRQITDHNLQNLDSDWYPELSLHGSAQYQSDVTEVDIEAPVPGADIDIPTQPHDRYEIGLHLNQRIYDGGITQNRRQVEERKRDARLQEIEVNQHQLRERVESAYFSVLQLRAQQSSLDLLKEDLETRIAETETARREGAVPGSAVDQLSAELIELRQNRMVLESRERAALKALSELIVTPLDEHTELILPEIDTDEVDLLFDDRPEIALFEAQKEQFESQRGMASSALRPNVSAFGQAAYGRPGLNLFEDEFQPWFIIGIRARWSFWDWGDQNRQQQTLSLQQQILNTRKDEFLRSMRAAGHEELEEIERLHNAMELDEELIELRGRVLREAESRMDHGAITATEYLNKLNDRHRAELSRRRHEIELAKVYVKITTRMNR